MFTQRSLRILIGLLRRDESAQSDDDEPVRRKWESEANNAPSVELCSRQICEISEELRLLEDRRLHLLDQQRVVRQTQNSMAPVNRLPVELLGEIILLSMIVFPIPDSYTRRRKVWTRSAPHVCHIWRAIVLSLPAAWSQIYVSQKTLPEKTTNFISRAGNRPLDVHLDFPYDPEDEDVPLAGSEVVVSAWAQISPHRIHSIYMYGDIDVPIMFPLKGNTSELRTLVLSGYFTGIPDDATSAFTIFTSCIPHDLHSLEVRAMENQIFSINLSSTAPKDLPHLKKLCFADNAQLVHATQVLTTCQSLEILEWDHADSFQQTPISLPRLKYLDFYGTNMLRLFELPQLHTLSISNLEHDDFEHLARFKSLRNLCLDSLAHIYDGTAFVASIPHIVHLKIQEVNPKPILRALSLPTPGATLGMPCPNLRVLRIECSRWGVDFGLLKTLMDQRGSIPSSPLELWVVSSNRPKPDRLEEWMENIHWGVYPSSEPYM
ncbi:hypothetical protein DL93DRAFT_109210 [Clavulina sp. PMI_390]|nr:hypothetical protein DL93DRAFT_109210 [Clavulina sp. PMI_390]